MEESINKETAEKLQMIRHQMVELKNQAKKLGCPVDEEIEGALQAIMAKEDEYWKNIETDWAAAFEL